MIVVDDLCNLGESNFIVYAMKTYDNPNCHSMFDFTEDLNRIKYVKRLINRYLSTGVLKDRLILNHLIILNNVFGPVHMRKLLFLRLDPDSYPVLKTFLSYLKIMPSRIDGIEGKTIINDNIPVDSNVLKVLESI
jgi:hypothetical protein